MSGRAVIVTEHQSRLLLITIAARVGTHAATTYEPKLI
jgi:hypothetical protein